MKVNILVQEKDTLELELVDSDQSLAQILAERLSADPRVEFAAHKMEHPLIGSPKLIVRSKKGDPAKIVLEKIEEIKKDVSEFRKEFLDIVK